MLTFPKFNPIALQLGPLAIRWYGLMYLLAFTLVLVLGRYRIRRQQGPISSQALDDLLFYGMLGTIIGGRLGYILFYQPSVYFHDPLLMLQVWKGGMSFHGGLLGVITGLALYARSRKIPFLTISDFVAPLVPLGLAAGRMGNFINGELWGRPTTVPWGMIFPGAPDAVPTPRHPSQIYELLFEGIFLFLLTWLYSARARPRGAVSGVFLIGYGCVRFGVEFTREPDAFLPRLALGLSMGQWLSLPMILVGAALVIYAYRRSPEKQQEIPAAATASSAPMPR
jgi:phosphatidylglycerol:prolipoprotein diacylglycerol transferase